MDGIGLIEKRLRKKSKRLYDMVALLHSCDQRKNRVDNEQQHISAP
jgi:hypothetical protein